MSNKKKDPKYDTNMEKNVFYWGLISSDVTISNLLKKKAGKGSGYDMRYVALMRNYLVYYKPGSKSEGAPGKYDLPQGIINLKRVNYNDVRIDADHSSFLIPAQLRTFEFVSTDDKILYAWVRVLKERAEAISKVDTSQLTDFPSTITTVQQLFPKSFSISGRVRIDMFDKFVEDRRKYAELLDKWDPYVRNASLFYECYFGENRHYMDWFVGSEGPSAVLQKTDEDALATWKAEVEKALKGAREIAEIRFFAEDLEDSAFACDRAVECIDGINKYSKEFLAKQHGHEDQYVKEREILTKFAASFRAFPSLRSIDYRTHRGGRVTGDNGDEFHFTLAAGIVSFKGKSGNTPMEFIAQGPELASKNDAHGTVVWNGRIWVWYHVKYPHTIRFDFDSKTKTFRYRPSPSANGAKADAASYADWIMEGPVMRCAGGQGKRAPSCLVWKIDGDLPICAVLLAGMTQLLLHHSNSV